MTGISGVSNASPSLKTEANPESKAAEKSEKEAAPAAPQKAEVDKPVPDGSTFRTSA